MDPREVQWPHYKEFMNYEVSGVLEFLGSLIFDSKEHEELIEKTTIKYAKYETLSAAEAKALWELNRLVTGS